MNPLDVLRVQRGTKEFRADQVSKERRTVVLCNGQSRGELDAQGTVNQSLTLTF